jgi:hypothetical protein
MRRLRIYNSPLSRRSETKTDCCADLSRRNRIKAEKGANRAKAMDVAPKFD